MSGTVVAGTTIVAGEIELSALEEALQLVQLRVEAVELIDLGLELRSLIRNATRGAGGAILMHLGHQVGREKGGDGRQENANSAILSEHGGGPFRKEAPRPTVSDIRRARLKRLWLIHRQQGSMVDC